MATRFRLANSFGFFFFVSFAVFQSIWFVTAFCHRYVEEIHRDYYILWAHHLATIALIAGSFSFNYLRIGLLVLAIHDPSDINVDLVKIFNLLKLQGPHAYYAVEIVYTCVLITWFSIRLYLFPFKV